MPSLPLDAPPASLCILRLSAIGDISHTLPVVRTLQDRWPDTRLTWIIGRTEHALVGDIPDVDFIIFDKRRGWRAYAEIRRQLRGRRFDVLLHMQMALRASAIALLVDAPVKLGFDHARARDAQWLFTNAQIAARRDEHVLDSLTGFSDALGATPRSLRWDIPIPDAAHAFAAARLPGAQPTLIVSPCASQPYRNWPADRLAAVANHAAGQLGMRVVLSGGPSKLEREYGETITQRMQHTPLNLIGQTDLKQLLALLARGSVLLAPDSGPAHLATAVGTPVIGLYACTNPARAGPYLSGQWLVNKYPQAAQIRHGKTPAQLRWGTRIRYGQDGAEAMRLIDVDDVLHVLHRLHAAGFPSTLPGSA